MNRRELIQRVLVGSTVLLVVPSVLESCTKSPLTPDPGTGGVPTSGNPVTVDLSLPGNSSLNTVGNYKVIGGVIIINTASGFVALSSVCTHQGATVGYDSASGNIVCPRHGSQFTTSGSLVNGPALTPLRTYTITIQNNILTVTG
jgi:cytochrome b6-f complex iron-sulfur subunit